MQQHCVVNHPGPRVCAHGRCYLCVYLVSSKLKTHLSYSKEALLFHASLHLKALDQGKAWRCQFCDDPWATINERAIIWPKNVLYQISLRIEQAFDDGSLVETAEVENLSFERNSTHRCPDFSVFDP